MFVLHVSCTHTLQYLDINFFINFREGGIYWSVCQNHLLQSRLSTCNCLYRCNDNYLINLGLSKGGVISWLLKSTSATYFTIWNSRERSPGDAPLPPDLVNVYSEKMAGKKAGKIGLNIAAQDCTLFSPVGVKPRFSKAFLPSAVSSLLDDYHKGC